MRDWSRAVVGSHVARITYHELETPYPAYSVIPSRCRVTYDRRLLAGETAEAVLGDITGLPGLEGIELRAAIAQGEHQTYTGAFLRGPKFLPA